MAVAFNNLIISRKRSIGKIRIDGFITESLTHSVRVTSNPIENGYDVTDHIIIQPIAYSMTGVITDTPLGYGAVSQLGAVADSVSGIFGLSEPSGTTRSSQVYEELLKILRAKEVVTVSSSIKRIDNLIFSSITVDKDKSSANSIQFSATFREALIVSSANSSIDQKIISGDKKKSGFSTSSFGGVGQSQIIDATTEAQVYTSLGQ